MSGANQPLTPGEKLMLANLLARVKSTEDDPEVMTPSSFALVEEDLQYMSDASKRRMEDPPEGFDSRRPYLAAPKNDIVGHTPKGKPICLPPGVDSVASWGRSIIQFGKFMSKKGAHEFTYKEIYDSDQEDDARYVRWVKGHVESGTGHLLDFAQYIVVRDCQRDPSGQMPVIPGTSVCRRFK
eukprot:s728_g14.t1